MADISRAEVSTLIEEEYSQTLLDAASAGSSALAAFRTVNMGTKTVNMPVLATLPEADWVAESATESDGVKPTSQVTWGNKTLVAEEIAVIVPVHENVIDDATVDILNEITTLAGAAIGKKLDQAVFFGTDKPASWISDDLLAAAVAASQTFEVVDGDANEDDLWGAINQAAAAVAQAGYNPSDFIASLGLRYNLANVRDGNGQPIFRDDSFAGFTTTFNRNGAWDASSASAFIVDQSRVLIGVRQDITVKFLDQATVGGINLAERDMVALRFKARYAYVLGNGVTSLGTGKTPVAVVTPDVTT
jgi:HK97 family phage major capsid protein